jgi:hypothetical protein
MKSRWRRRVRGHPATVAVIVLAVAWLALEAVVGLDFLTDRYGAYAGTVRDIKTTWIDRLTLDFTPVEHLIIETDDGRIIDKLVSVENRAFFRIAVGDRVEKARGFGSHARVPGKPSVAELLEAASGAESGR